VHNILDKKPEKLVEYEDISVEDSNLEYLIGLDYCTYRIPCTTVMGDRSYKLTRKRFESKKAMLDVYKEAQQLATQKKSVSDGRKENAKTIFDLGVKEVRDNTVGLENSVRKLQTAIQKVKQADP
jgi:hypothetical protein